MTSAGTRGAPNLLVVDPRADGIAQLLAKPPAQTDIRFLKPDQDGYRQIADILQERGDTADIRIQAGDSSGKAYLGNSQLSQTLSAGDSQAIMDWGDNLTSVAQITFHGEPGRVGQSWLTQFQALTGGQTAWTSDPICDHDDPDATQNSLADADDSASATNAVDSTQTAEQAQDDLMPAAVSSSPAPVALVFVDTGISGYQALLQGIDPNATVILLDPTKDGVEQIAQAASQYGNIQAIHIISHGDAGQLRLGTGVLNEASMQGEYADELASIRARLGADADILVYGCNFGQGEAGQNAANLLALLTGADVASSNDTTGNADLGGDWVLETQSGTIETAALANNHWDGLLALTNTGATPWTITRASNTTSLIPALASNTTDGVTTLVSFSSATANTWNGATGATLNNIAAFANSAQNTGSLQINFGPVNATTAQTGTLTITFSQAVTNPIIHIDRLGGTTGANISYSPTYTLTTLGATLTRLAGPAHFLTTATTFSRQAGIVVAGGAGESSLTNTAGSAAGSVQVNGTFTAITFNVSSPSGFDTHELAFAFDAPPVAQPDLFNTTGSGTISGNLFANNGVGIDSDIRGDAITLNQVNGTAVTVNTPIALANGTLTITNAATGDFSFTPNTGFDGVQTFTYNVRDPNGGVSINATAAINVVGDTDADGINNNADIDDDNDGLLDTTEGVTTGTSAGSIGFRADRTLGGFFQNGVFARNSDVAWATYLRAGTGVNLTTVKVPQDLFSVTNASTTSLAQAITARDYVETLIAPSGNQILNGFNIQRQPSSLGAGSFRLGVTIVDSLGTETTLLPDFNMPLNTTSGTINEFVPITAFNMEAGKSYSVRIYFFSVTGNAYFDQVTFDSSPIINNDTDGDGIANSRDLDSDNDGISDLYESTGGTGDALADTNSDGTVTSAEGGSDADGDGLMDIFDANLSDTTGTASLGNTPINTDGDSRTNYLDLDSDGDGLADTVEARLTTGYVANNGVSASPDTDRDGIIGLFDTTTGFGGNFTAPVNTDGADLVDYLDTDSDNDTNPDGRESGLTPGVLDANGDGIADGTGASYANPDGAVTNNQASLLNEIGDTSQVAYREIVDTDGDGVANAKDIDDDNDGILDSVERSAGSVTGSVIYLQDSTNLYRIDGVNTANPVRTIVGAALGPIVTDIALSRNGGLLYGVVSNSRDFISINTTTAATAVLGQLPAGAIGPTALSMDASGNLYAGPGGSSTIYRFNPTNPAGATVWYTMPNGNASGDFVFLENRAFTAWFNPTAGVNELREIFMDASGNAIGHTVLGVLPDLSFGMTVDELGNFYVVATPASTGIRGLYRLDVPSTPLSGGTGVIPVTLVPNTTNVRNYFGATSSVETYAGANIDTDGDGVFNHLDLDSDNDGISDLSESTGGTGDATADANSDGTVTSTEGGGDADGDGLMDIFDANTASTTSNASLGNTPINTDGDSRQNYVDLDSEGDGIADTVEARLTAGYVTNNGVSASPDTDGDGIIGIFDTTTGFGGNFSPQVNTDAAFATGADTSPDYLDTDSDNDGKLDSVESGLSAVTTDANNDGIRDSVGASYANPDGTVNNPQTNLSNELGDTTQVAFREKLDTDGDGIANGADLDDDNDGILDTVENPQLAISAVTTSGFGITGQGNVTIGGTTANYLTTTTEGTIALASALFDRARFTTNTTFASSNALALNGQANNGTATVTTTFSRPVINPVLAITSIGGFTGTDTFRSLTFDQGFIVLDQYDTASGGTTTPTLTVNTATRTIRGAEDGVIIQFIGTFSAISYTTT